MILLFSLRIELDYETTVRRGLFVLLEASKEAGIYSCSVTKSNLNYLYLPLPYIVIPV